MFHFFSDVDLLASQSASDAFGRVDGTTFRVTSVHRALGAAAPKAYAVCGGDVFVQDGGSGLVNLVLKPSEQPPFAFPRIKFFIYRGIVKGSLVAGSDVAPPSSNDLTKAIWDAQARRNAREQTSSAASAKALGIHVTGNGSADEVFYQIDQTHQLQHVAAGWSLGTFSSQFGFEIVVDAPGYDPPLSMVRKTSNVITVAALPSGATAAQHFARRTAKEEVLNYVAPCAFFGGFARHGLRVKTSSGSFTAKPPFGVYDEVLKGAHLTAPADGVFDDRNTTYVDIRNEYAHSLDYFGNYGGNVYVAFGAHGAASARDYYASGWPLMTIANADLPSGVSSRKVTCRIALPQGDNLLPTLYVSSGYLASEFPGEPQQRARLVDLTIVSGRTSELALAIPNRGGTPTTTAISSYIRLKYVKRFDATATAPPQSSATVIRARNFLDNVFAPFDFKIPFSGPGKIKSMIYDSEVFIDMSRSGGFDEIASVGVLDDGTTYTFILHPKITRPSNLQITTLTPFSGEVSKRTADPWVHVAKRLDAHEAQQSTLQLGNQTTAGYVEIIDDGSEVDEPYVGVTLITCDKAQLLATDRSGFAPWSPLYLGAHNMVRYADTLGREYWNFNISLIGFDDEATPSVKEVVTGITIYLYGDLSRRDVILVGTDGLVSFQSTAQAVPPVPPIKHIFVLMLENRSFDHMLGFSRWQGTDAKTGRKTKIDGASRDNKNTNIDTGIAVGASAPADFVIPEGDQGPPHEFKDVLRQLCGIVVEDTYYDSPNDPRSYPVTDNSGYIYSYASGSVGGGGEKKSRHPERIMRCFAPSQVPILATLAEDFAVCDNWYSSMPGPTWPNRFFLHAATSGGLDDSPGLPETVWRKLVKGFSYDNGTIYDRIDARSLFGWRIYEDEDSMAQSLVLENMNDWRMTLNYRGMSRFAADVGSLHYWPLYTFIEPHYGNLNPLIGDYYLWGNSQHPRDDVRAGEILIKNVYEAIRNSPHWQNSVLVITYDEHGGFYDHAQPGSAHPPGDSRPYATDNRFDFARLGPRVPAVIVSPLIPARTIDHTIYDHTSILATLERAFQIHPLTERDRKANDFRHLFSLLTPRIAPEDARLSFDTEPPTSFPDADGPPTYKGHSEPVTIPPYVPPLLPTPIDAPIRWPRFAVPEDDIDKMLAENPALQPPATLIGDHSAELLGWLHAAFRRRLATQPRTNEAWRRQVLEEYCGVTTVQEAYDFIQKGINEGKAFREATDDAQPIGGPNA